MSKAAPLYRGQQQVLGNKKLPLCWKARRLSTSGDMAIGTQSTLRASARSSCRVLGSCLIPYCHGQDAYTNHPPYEQMLVKVGWVPSLSPSLLPIPQPPSICPPTHLMARWVVLSPVPLGCPPPPSCPVHPPPLRATARSGGGVIGGIGSRDVHG
jgi:hypothetical protein